MASTRVRDRVVELRRVRAGDLGVNPRNWRRHPDGQRRALRGVLEEIGYADALLAREDGDELVLVDGHLRADLDPDQQVPVLILDVSESEADTLLATLDPIGALAQGDRGRLAELLDRVSTSNSAVRELLEGLARSSGLPVDQGLVDPDDIPDAAESVSRPGDLWTLGEHRVLCGDATIREDVERAMGGAQADVIWTDPPYGVGYVGKTRRALTIENDDEEGLSELLRGALAAVDAVTVRGAAIYVAHPAGPQSVSFAQAFLEAGWTLRQTLVWVKDAMVLGHGDYHYRHEPILYGCKPGRGRWGRGHRGWFGGNAETSVLEVPRPRASREHPTAKPVELVRRCLANSAGHRAVVLDPFCGSGSTLVAAQMQGCRFVGIDLDPRYVDVTVSRWEAFTGGHAIRI